MFKRLGFILYGCFGVITIIPNIMLADGPDPRMKRKAYVCLIGTMCILTSSIMGLFYNKFLPIEYAINVGIIGAILQFGGLLV